MECCVTKFLLTCTKLMCNVKKIESNIILVSHLGRSRQFGVGLSSVLAPLSLKLVIENFSSATSRQSGLGQRQLAHLHVVVSGHQENRDFVGFHFHLTYDPATVEVSVPPIKTV